MALDSAGNVDGERNVWINLLGEQSKKRIEDPIARESNTPRKVLVLGNPGSGKRCLVKALRENGAKYTQDYFSRMCGMVSPPVVTHDKKTSGHCDITIAGLGYSFLEVPFDKSVIEFWLLEDFEAEGTKMTPKMLSIALPTLQSLLHSAAMIVVDISQPWSAMDTLKHATELLDTHIKNLMKSSAVEEIEEKVSKNQNACSDPYVRLENLLWTNKRLVTTADGSEVKFSSSGENEHSESDSNLPKGMLKTNIGIPLFVVGTKADVIGKAPKHIETDLRFEFIQRHLRNFCLSYGATLSYTSAGENADTCRSLLCSLFQSLFTGVFVPSADDLLSLSSVRDAKERVHVPSGIDNLELISTLANTRSGRIVSWSADSPFDSVIQSPSKVLSGSNGAIGSRGEIPSSPFEKISERVDVSNQAFLKRLFAQQKDLPDMVSVKSTNAAGNAIQLLNMASNSMSTGNLLLSPAKIHPGGAGDSSPLPARGNSLNMTQFPSGIGLSNELLHTDSISLNSESAVRNKTVTPQDVKEDPNLVASFFKNLLEKGST